MVFVIKSKYSSVSLFETELNKWYFYCFSAEETLTHYQYTVSFALLQVISQTTEINSLGFETLSLMFIFGCAQLCKNNSFT